MPSGLFSLRLTFERSKLESLRDISVTRIGDTFPTVFGRLFEYPHKLSVNRLMPQGYEIEPPRIHLGNVDDRYSCPIKKYQRSIKDMRNGFIPCLMQLYL